MSPPPSSALSHLSRVWGVFSGHAVEFTPCRIDALPSQSEFCVSLGITVGPDESLYHRLALVLLISHAQAMEVASLMFDRPASELADDELLDACSEICNVLAHPALLGVSSDQAFDIGSRQRLSDVEYHALLAHGTSHRVYRSTGHEPAVYVIVCQPDTASTDWAQC